MISDLSTTSSPALVKATIPACDLDLFAELNDRTRKLVRRRLKAMVIMNRAPSVRQGAHTFAAMFHGERGMSAKRLMNLYKEYVDAQCDWRVLVDAAIAGPAWQTRYVDAGLPVAFLTFLAEEWSQNQRGKLASAYNRLIQRYRRWRLGDQDAAIPGYTECPEPDALSPQELPTGWTYSNLGRAVKPYASKFARKLIQIGPKAASQLGPQVPGTREGLQVGQYLILDDSWNDFKVIAFGQSCRLLAFHVLDLFSGCNVARGYKPALRDQETKIQERLKEREMIWLLVKHLTTDGYRPDGTTIICEKSTATVPERQREILALTMGNTITVNDGPAGGGPGVSGLFTGPGGGNPKWKAPLESWFNLLRNRTDNLIEFPGQTGSNSRLNVPEGLPGIEKDTLALLNAVRKLAPEKAELMRLGQLLHTEAIFRLDAITEVINCRNDHDLEGWRKCEHFTQEFRLNAQMRWLPMMALLGYDQAERDAVAAVLANDVTSGTLLKRTRALSPREVYDAGRGDLVKLPMPVAAMLMDELPGIERPVKNNQIEISVPEVDPTEPLVFGLTRRDGRGVKEPLRNDDKYLVRVNPLDPSRCWLFTADNKFAGIADFFGRAPRTDVDAVNRKFAEKRQALAPMIEEARRLAAPITRVATDRIEHNTAILGPKPAPKRTSEEREEGRAAADALLAATTPAEPRHDRDDEAPASSLGDDLLRALAPKPVTES